MGRKQFAMIGMACGAAAIIFTFFNWVSGDSSTLELWKKMGKGTSGFSEMANGTFPFILALVGTAATSLVFLGQTKLVPLDGRQLLFAACAAFGLAGLILLISPINSNFGDNLGRGWAVWVVTLAHLGGAAVAFLGTLKKGGATVAAAVSEAAKAVAEKTPATDSAGDGDGGE